MEEEEEEEWLVESLSLYNDLHVFELQDPTRVIEWTGEKSVCVAGYENPRRNEILQLLLPQRLCSKWNQGLCPERDFKVELGGFSDRPVYGLKHVPQTSLMVTSGPPDGALQVWRMEPEETGVIKPTGTISPSQGDERSSSVKMATTSSWAACVLHGLKMNDIQMTEVESGKTVFAAGTEDQKKEMKGAATTEEKGFRAFEWSELATSRKEGFLPSQSLGREQLYWSASELSSLHFLDEATLLACSDRGRLCLADTRQPQGELGDVKDATLPSALGGHSWTAGVRPGPPEPAGGKPLVARLSTGGHVVLTDLRSPASPLSVAQCGVAPAPGFRGVELLSVSFAPLLKGHLAVSGFDGIVRIYETQQWDSATHEAQPVFLHKGHVFGGPGGARDPPLVTTHTWHPSKPRTLLSAASDGSLHVWDWADPHGSAAQATGFAP